MEAILQEILTMTASDTSALKKRFFTAQDYNRLPGCNLSVESHASHVCVTPSRLPGGNLSLFWYADSGGGGIGGLSQRYRRAGAGQPGTFGQG